MEKQVVPVAKEMELFIPTEVFRKKSNTFQGTTGRDPFNENVRKTSTEANGTAIFEKFVSKLLDNFRRLSFFPKIWKFREVSVPLGISFRLNTRTTWH